MACRPVALTCPLVVPSALCDWNLVPSLRMTLSIVSVEAHMNSFGSQPPEPFLVPVTVIVTSLPFGHTFVTVSPNLHALSSFISILQKFSVVQASLARRRSAPRRAVAGAKSKRADESFMFVSVYLGR